MSPDTARKVVVGGVLVGSAAILYGGRNRSFATNYRRVWGLVLLGIGGAALADFAPGIVGPYMVLVIMGMLLANQSGLGGLFQAAGQAVSGKSAPTDTAGGTKH